MSLKIEARYSPLARGTHVYLFTEAVAERFIPAGAGNTQSHWTPQTGSTVYPRWRGEHWLVVIGNLIICGLSPLARGTLRIYNRHPR